MNWKLLWIVGAMSSMILELVFVVALWNYIKEDFAFYNMRWLMFFLGLWVIDVRVTRCFAPWAL